MTDEERRGYRALFDATKRFILNAEAFEGDLTKLPSNATRDSLLASAHAHLTKLRTEANELEKLGWMGSFAGRGGILR